MKHLKILIGLLLIAALGVPGAVSATTPKVSTPAVADPEQEDDNSSLDSLIVQTESVSAPVSVSAAEKPVQVIATSSAFEALPEAPEPESAEPETSEAEAPAAPAAEASVNPNPPTAMRKKEPTQAAETPATVQAAKTAESPAAVQASAAESAAGNSVPILRPRDEHDLLTVGDFVYLSLPGSKTLAPNEKYLIYRSGAKYSPAAKHAWGSERIGKLEIWDISPQVVTGRIVAANDIIRKGDLVCLQEPR